MLALIRDKISGWIATLIIGLLVISFALWGIGSYSNQANSVNIAQVNDAPITLLDYQRALHWQRQRIQELLGDQANAIDDRLIKENTLENLINAEILHQISEDERLSISDQQMRSNIEQFGQSQEDSHFSRPLYEARIANMGMKLTEFEHQIRLELLTEQLQRALADSGFLLNEELAYIHQLRTQTRDIHYALLTAQSYRDEREANAADIAQYYAEHPERYREDEKIRIAFIDLDMDKLSAALNITEIELQDYYESNPERFELEAQRSLSQLFIRFGEDKPSEETINTVRQRIEEVAALTQAGETLEAILQRYQEEDKKMLEFSAHDHTKPGRLSKPIDDFLFSADQGAISDPIKTDLGFHIVRLDDIKGEQDSFQQLRAQIETDYRQQQAEELFFEKINLIENLSYEHPDSLAPAADTAELDIQETDFFTLQATGPREEGILRYPAVVKAAFSEAVKGDRVNSDPIELSDSRILVIRVIEQKAARLRPLETIREELIHDMKETAMIEKMIEQGEEIVERLKAGEDRDALGKQYNLVWEEGKGIQRDALNINRAISRAAFRMGKPVDTPLYQGVLVGKDGYAVIISNTPQVQAQVQAQAQANQATEEKESKQQSYDDILRRYALYEWDQFMADARYHADIRILNNTDGL